MFYFVDVFQNIKCLRNIYFIYSILLNMKQMLVFILFYFFFLVLSFPPRPPPQVRILVSSLLFTIKQRHQSVFGINEYYLFKFLLSSLQLLKELSMNIYIYIYIYIFFFFYNYPMFRSLSRRGKECKTHTYIDKYIYIYIYIFLKKINYHPKIHLKWKGF